MRNYQDEQNKNYENTKQMFEACRKDVGDSKKARRTMPIVDDEICFADIPENGVCITSQFENGLCGEIIWCRSGEDVYMLHSSIRLADHTVWLQMDKKGNSEALHLKLLSKEGNEKVQQDEFQGLYISPRMQVKRFYEYCFWPNYIRGKRPAQLFFHRKRRVVQYPNRKRVSQSCSNSGFSSSKNVGHQKRTGKRRDLLCKTFWTLYVGYKEGIAC